MTQTSDPGVGLNGSENGNGRGRLVDRVLIGFAITALGGYAGVSTDDRNDKADKSDVREKQELVAARIGQLEGRVVELSGRLVRLREERVAACRQLRVDVIDVLYLPGGRVPPEFRAQAERIFRRSSC